MRIFLAIFLSFFMTSCSSKGYPPQARIDIHTSTEDQGKVIEAMKRFGSGDGFEVLAGNNLPKKGRLVSQVELKRADGVVVSMDNFMNPDTLQTFFYAEKPDANWRSVKEAWLKAVTEALADRGEITEVPVGPHASLVEEERKKHLEDKSDKN